MDYSKVWMLMEIIHKASSAGPNYAWVATWANGELDKLKANMGSAAPVARPTIGGSNG